MGDVKNAAIGLLSGIIAGVFGGFLSLSWMLIIVYCRTQSFQSRLSCWCLFFVGASAPTLVASAEYGISNGAALPVLALACVNALVLSLAQSKRYALVTVPLAIVALSVPPLAAINVLSLLPAAGVLFPSTGTLGLMLLLLLTGIQASHISRWWLLPIALSSIGAIGTVSADEGTTITGVDLYRTESSPANEALFARAYREEERYRVASATTGAVVFPEGVFDEWSSDRIGRYFADSHRTIYGGARAYQSDTKYINTIVNAANGTVVYEQASPPPIQRYRKEQALRGNGVLVKTPYAFVICYEVLNPFLMWQRAKSDRSAVVWVANLSWSRQPFLANRLASIADAWASLYGKPVVTSVLRHG